MCRVWKTLVRNSKPGKCGDFLQNNNLIENALKSSWEHARGFLEVGRVSDYIPHLAAANPAHLGCVVMDADGTSHQIGDWNEFFTIQSISKVLSLMYALETLGYDEVFAKVGMEPSGDPFNCFIKLETVGERPFNPFINAGAITVIALLAENVPFQAVLDYSCKIFGGSVAIDEEVFLQEMRAGKRNRSMAYLMASKGALGDDVEAYLNFYFSLCALSVNTAHLAHMGAVLASGGKNPRSGEEIVPGPIVRIAKAIMLTCGMYDGSGEFAVTVGLPAKSGIGGGIVACGGGLGIGTFGPALDAKGNSVGGLAILRQLSEKLGIHLF